jgi:hypothetical protein
VTMVVPEDAFVGPNPQVGWWHEGKKEWDTDGITDVSFDTETRRLTFASVRMTALSLVQSRVASLPYKSWVIRPLGPNAACVTVSTAVDTVELRVSESAVRLVAPVSASLDASHPQGMAPGLLLKTLQSFGLNLAPSSSDALLVRGLVPKDKGMEAFACKEIANIAPGFAVTYSCHNQRLPDTGIAVRTRPWMDFSAHPDMETSDAWQLVHFRMAPLLMCAINPTAEAAEAWTEQRPAQIPSACAHVSKLLSGSAPDTCQQRCDDASPLFLETLCAPCYCAAARPCVTLCAGVPPCSCCACSPSRRLLPSPRKWQPPRLQGRTCQRRWLTARLWLLREQAMLPLPLQKWWPHRSKGARLLQRSRRHEMRA